MHLGTTGLGHAPTTGLAGGKETLLIERLQMYGLIEPDGQGGWQLTVYAQARLGSIKHEPPAPVSVRRVDVRPWLPRRL